jgi:hypothetical protein
MLHPQVKNKAGFHMTSYTKQQFKELWNSDDAGGGITWDDIADCAIAWGLASKPRTMPLEEVRTLVEAASEEEAQAV